MTPGVTAWVRIGAVETEYRRIGSGPPVLLLVVPEGDPPVALTQRWRFLLPLGSSNDTGASAFDANSFGRWLDDFLEGLGLSGVYVVVPPAMATDLGALRLADPDRVLRVLTVPDAASDWSTIGAQLASGGAEQS